MKKADLLEVLKEQLNKQNKYISSFENDKNPQIVALCNTSKGSRDTLEATIHYIETGSKLYF